MAWVRRYRAFQVASWFYQCVSCSLVFIRIAPRFSHELLPSFFLKKNCVSCSWISTRVAPEFFIEVGVARGHEQFWVARRLWVCCLFDFREGMSCSPIFSKVAPQFQLQLLATSFFVCQLFFKLGLPIDLTVSLELVHDFFCNVSSCYSISTEGGTWFFFLLKLQVATPFKLE